MSVATVRQTPVFTDWLSHLRDRGARTRIEVRVVRLGHGNAGQSCSVGEGVHELKIDYGPGYRVYFIRRGDELIVLLCGGDKSSQSEDIKAAKKLAHAWSLESQHGTEDDGI